MKLNHCLVLPPPLSSVHRRVRVRAQRVLFSLKEFYSTSARLFSDVPLMQVEQREPPSVLTLCTSTFTARAADLPCAIGLGLCIDTSDRLIIPSA